MHTPRDHALCYPSRREQQLGEVVRYLLLGKRNLVLLHIAQEVTGLVRRRMVGGVLDLGFGEVGRCETIQPNDVPPRTRKTHSAKWTVLVIGVSNRQYTCVLISCQGIHCRPKLLRDARRLI